MKNKKFLYIIGLNLVASTFMLNMPSVKASEVAHSCGKAAEMGKNAIKAEIFLKGPLVKDKKMLTEIEFISKNDNKPLLPTDIRETHTEIIHLLIFDQTLKDYQH